MIVRTCWLVTSCPTNHGKLGKHGHSVCLVTLVITRRVTRQVTNQADKARDATILLRCARLDASNAELEVVDAPPSHWRGIADDNGEDPHPSRPGGRG
jgi:hypothetical protein